MHGRRRSSQPASACLVRKFGAGVEAREKEREKAGEVAVQEVSEVGRGEAVDKGTHEVEKVSR